MKLEVEVKRYPEQLSESGTYVIQTVKGPQETRFGQALILTVANSKNSERSLFVAYSAETSKNSNLARMIAAYSVDTEKWVNKKIRVTVDADGKRRVDPLGGR